MDITDAGGSVAEADQYDLPGQLSYYGWLYFTPANPPEIFTLQCKFPLSEWQSTLCTTENQSFYRP